MSDSSRRRLIRAVRLVPEAVRIGMAPVEPENSELESEVSEEAETLELEEARWRSVCEDLEARLRASEESCRSLQDQWDEREASREKETAELRAKIEEDGKKACEEGRAKGFAEGKEKGLTEGRLELEAEIRSEMEKKLSGAIELLNEVHRQIEGNLEELLAANPYRLVRLWQKVLSRLLVREVAFDQEAALRLLKGLLSRASEKEDLRVYLNPDDLDLIESQKGNFGDLMRGIRNIEFMADDEVDKGSCIVETGLGIYDARWRTQLEQIGVEVEGVLTEGMANDEDR
ncbi:flagellar assembly protein FliH [Dethiosulfovibrio sp. F2B]|uniref:FliH/SctL family protein n=1 Tax=Dethiosulfovibrio faecalis TaxID=2720018 RepID=UPI001F29C0DA|nr:FliH/SctL family protein [Dethiosulfovibrio faecalis]MCF4150614.1 flagellar assembly protein FliH [Dethiosulfovibrio faecalis]